MLHFIWVFTVCQKYPFRVYKSSMSFATCQLFVCLVTTFADDLLQTVWPRSSSTICRTWIQIVWLSDMMPERFLTHLSWRLKWGISMPMVWLPSLVIHSHSQRRTSISLKVEKAKIRNRYNPVPHLTQDTICESDENTRKHHTQEVSSFPGDHKAARNRQDSIAKTKLKRKWQKGSTKEEPLWNGQQKNNGGRKHAKVKSQ